MIHHKELTDLPLFPHKVDGVHYHLIARFLDLDLWDTLKGMEDSSGYKFE
jgi:hypothetical protein